jgi:aminopeptidase-like protein
MAMLWLLNLGDGSHSLLDVAGRSDLPLQLVREVAWLLRDKDLLVPASEK